LRWLDWQDREELSTGDLIIDLADAIQDAVLDINSVARKGT